MDTNASRDGHPPTNEHEHDHEYACTDRDCGTCYDHTRADQGLDCGPDCVHRTTSLPGTDGTDAGANLVSRTPYGYDIGCPAILHRNLGGCDIPDDRGRDERWLDERQRQRERQPGFNACCQHCRADGGIPGGIPHPINEHLTECAACGTTRHPAYPNAGWDMGGIKYDDLTDAEKRADGST